MIVCSVAGADSVAISLRCVLYQLMKRPDTLQKCVDEISAADASGLLSKPVQYNETTSHLPYTCACIKEAARIFPAFQVHMGRHAPSEGLELCGYYIPAGYRVSMNAGLVQLDPFLFGSDAREFKPERWLQSQERNFAMEKGMLNFGAGTRTCSGRHISLFTILRAMYTFRRVCAKIAQIATVELHKLIPEIIRHFRIAMAHNRGWKTRNAAFIKQKDLIVKVALK